MTEMFEFLKVYKDLGVAGLFIGLELLTVFYFYKELKNSKSESMVMVRDVTCALDKATAAITEMNRASVDSKQNMDLMRAQNNEFMSFLKGRDEHRRSR